ncbi:cytochrome P450 [Truncatella angustata]|uniref:Cytochrome P450 n=1 Tax=Truncatella angustata TaxID=152316 RepID=A0A9P8USZ4_9PEZI|nr:cytochrome P450 [Truncatella angustata]KAH6657631.1 cytochrome P450 [Truncatella angustata]
MAPSTDNSWGTILLLIVSPFVLTWLYTSIRFNIEAKSGSKAPTLPYVIPFLGHSIPFFINSDKFLRRVREQYGSLPLQLIVGPNRWTYIPHGQTVHEVFKSPKSAANKAMQLRVLSNLFDVPDEDMAILEADNTGFQIIPAPGTENFPHEKRWFHHNHSNSQSLLQGKPLFTMTQTFLDKYTARLQKKHEIQHDQWTEVPDLFGFVQTDMLRAAMEAMCGDHVYELAPNFDSNYWAFDAAMPTLLKQVPRWLAPKAWAARDKILKDVRAWLEYADKHFDWDNQELTGTEWEPVYGSRLMRARQEAFRLTGQTKNADPNQQLGLIWATNSNVIPATFYSLLGLLLSENLEARITAEVDSAFIGTGLNVDLPKLCSGKLLTSVYLESLRYSFGIMLIRVPTLDNFWLGGYAYGKKDTLVYSTWAAHHDAKFWNTGRISADGHAEHSVDSWWGERFLEYPDDPASGPIRKPDPEVYRQAKMTTRDAKDDQHATVVTAGLAGHFYPYGGGSTICPGRHFAKQELMAAVALLLRTFEFQLVDPAAAAKLQPDVGSAFGTMMPDRAVSARIRRRRL